MVGRLVNREGVVRSATFAATMLLRVVVGLMAKHLTSGFHGKLGYEAVAENVVLGM